MARISCVPSGAVTVTRTFLRVSPAAHGRSSRGKRALRWSTSVAMVGVSGVSSTCAAGVCVQSWVGGTGTITASTFAAYPQFGHRT